MFLNITQIVKNKLFFNYFKHRDDGNILQSKNYQHY